MKKHGWLLLLTAVLALVLVFCLYIQRRSKPAENPVAFLSFRVYSDEASGASEDIVCWNQDEEKCFVFLPSWADLDRTEVQLNASRNCQLGGVQLTQGLNCGCFAPDTDYELTGEGLAPRTLRFVRSAGIAAMYIDTYSGSMEQVLADKTRRERAAVTLYTADGRVDYQGTDFTDQIRGHGNSTWNYDKKPFNLYLYESASLLDMDASADWVLIANAADSTGLRNKLVYDFAAGISPRSGWVPECEYVDLFLNGEYAGLYLLCEKAQVVAGKFKDNNDELVTVCLNNHVTKLDNPETALKLDDTIFAEIAAPSVATAAGYSRLEAYLRELADALPGESWADYIDLDTFARKYLIEEIFANTDGGQASQYYYWDRSENRLYAGPCWDYDLTLGDTTWVDWISPCSLMMQSTLWYRDLWTHESFAEYVRELYCSECLPLLNRLLEDLPALTENLEKASGADHLRWSAMYEKNQGTASLPQFLSDRVAFLNSLWADQAEYCEVSFASRGPKGNPLVSLFVPAGSPGSLVPSPEEMGLEEASVWYLRDSGEPFDPDSAITEDLTLCLEGEPAEEAEEPAVLSSGNKLKILALVVTVIPFLLLIPALLFIEYRRGRAGKEKRS